MLYEIALLFLGWLYPAFGTYRDIDTDIENQSTWMKYWIVMAVYTGFHYITAGLDPWVPCLSSFKVIILCWLVPTIGGGSQLAFDEFLDPLLRRNSENITRAIDNISDAAGNMLCESIKLAYNLAVDIVDQCYTVANNADGQYISLRHQAAVDAVFSRMRLAQRGAARIPQAETHLEPAESGAKNSIEVDSEDEFICEMLKGIPDSELGILQAEAECAVRMQSSKGYVSQEYLAPINYHANVCDKPDSMEESSVTSETIEIDNPKEELAVTYESIVNRNPKDGSAVTEPIEICNPNEEYGAISKPNVIRNPKLESTQATKAKRNKRNKRAKRS